MLHYHPAAISQEGDSQYRLHAPYLKSIRLQSRRSTKFQIGRITVEEVELLRNTYDSVYVPRIHYWRLHSVRVCMYVCMYCTGMWIHYCISTVSSQLRHGPREQLKLAFKSQIEMIESATQI